MSAVAPLALEVQDVRHSADSCRWYSPPSVVEPARELLGGFDLDPASDAAANFAIRAERIFTEADDGLAQQWSGRTWCNPPTPPREWWLKLVRHHLDGEVPAAIFVAYSLEQIQQSQLWAEQQADVAASMLDFPVCVPRRRITYMRTAADALVAWEKQEVRYRARGKNVTRGALVERDALRALPTDQLVAGDSPAHASCIVGLGVDRAAFAKAYGSLGWCSP